MRFAVVTALCYSHMFKVEWIILIIFKIRENGKEWNLIPLCQLSALSLSLYPFLFLVYTFVYKNAIGY